MKYFKSKMAVIIILMIAFAFGKANAKHVVVPKMYMFGFAASFNDTIVHFTNVMEVDSVWIESKNNFLLGRSLYSHQLRNYLSASQQLSLRTCIVMYGDNRTKLEKKLLKMKKLYTMFKDGKLHFHVRFLEDTEFHFLRLRYEDVADINAVQGMENKKTKVDKKQPKKGRKGGK